MKSSFYHQQKKPNKRHLTQPLTSLNFQNHLNRKVTFVDNNQTQASSKLDRRSASKKEVKYKAKSKQKSDENEKLTQEISVLKQNLKKGRSYRNLLLQKMQNSNEKQNTNGFNLTFSSSFKPNLQVEEATDILLEEGLFNKNIIADSFLGSFRAAFAFYVQLYFQKMTLALQLKEKYMTVFSKLARYLDLNFVDSKTLIQVDNLCLAIYRIIKNKNVDYKIVDIKYGMNKRFSGKSLLYGKEFAQLFQTLQKNTYLTNPSQCLMNLNLEEIMKAFFQVFAQFYDTQIKFKKICQANQKKLTNLIMKLRANSELSVKMLAEFLYFDVQKSKKWLVLRFQQFFKDHFGTKNHTVNFLKWIRQNK